MTNSRKIGFIFPGQGAQYPGMAKDFYSSFAVAKHTFQEADDILKRNLSSIVFDGPEAELTETKNSQLGIYVASTAILRVVQELFPTLKPSVTSGLSLGEYTALFASGKISFADCLQLVDKRAQYMNDACEETKGTMAVVVGLSADDVKAVVAEVSLPNDLWAANFNCPGQVVLSGTIKGIEAGSAAAKARGAKRVLPIQVHGAFHSGLMKGAGERLAPHIEHVKLTDTHCPLVMNVPGDPAKNLDEVRKNLILQVTHPVCWEQGMRHMIADGVNLFVELGCGKVLSGFAKRIDPNVTCVSVEKVEDIPQLETYLKG